MLRTNWSGFRRFGRNTRGNVAILFGLAVIPILIGIGLAVDYGRALIERERMASAADAAALAIGSWTNLSENDLKTKAQQFFQANYTPTYGKAAPLQVKIAGNDINVSVSGSVPTTFMQLINVRELDIGANAVITKRQRNIELALVLDTTGSMGSGGKMSAMTNAATDMVDDLFGGNSTSDTLKVAVVPFSGAVNIGRDKLNSGWLDKGSYPNISSISKENFDFDNGESIMEFFEELEDRRSSWKWAGCVRERAEPYELTDAAPTPGNRETLFTPYLAPDEPDSDNDGSYNGNTYIDDDGCGERRSRNRTAKVCQEYTGKYSSPSTDRSSASPNQNCPPNPITALTDRRRNVTSAIDDLDPEGNTVIPAGLLWGWRVLSPGEPFTEGKDYSNKDWVKAIVLLTDGENNVNGGQSINGSVFNAFGFKSNGHLGYNTYSELNSKTQDVCNAIKAQDILIYTIGFQVSDSTTRNLLRSCATKPEMYYNSPSNAELASIFKDIAQGLSDLRIAQ